MPAGGLLLIGRRRLIFGVGSVLTAPREACRSSDLLWEQAVLKLTLMRRRPLLVGAGLLLTGQTAGAAPSTFQITPAVASVVLFIRQLHLFEVEAVFRRFSGNLVLDMAKPEQTRIDLTLDATSVEMSDTTRTQQLRSPDFLSVAAYPAIRFASTSVKTAEPMLWEVQGILHMRGNGRPLSLTARVSTRDQRVMFDASGELSRTAFGMTADPLLISDAVRLQVRMRLQMPG